MELVNKAFKIFKKLQKLDDSDFESQVECQSSIFKLMLGMTDEDLIIYNSKCEEFLKESKKR
jgi:hypothetical protein